MSAFLNDLGVTSIRGNVVQVESYSFPFKCTVVTFVLVAPNGVLVEDTTTKTYNGHFSFEVGQVYDIISEKSLGYIYPSIVRMDKINS